MCAKHWNPYHCKNRLVALDIVTASVPNSVKQVNKYTR